MKHIDYFNDFLKDKVNLNQSRIDSLESSVDSIKDLIKNSLFKDSFVRFSTQGSWAHKTIIRPLPAKVFDADLLLIVSPVDGWTAKDYLNNLKKIFESNGTYADKIKFFSHCVTIEYASDKRIDIAICVERTNYYATYLEVCNKDDDRFEPSYPEEYTDWVKSKNQTIGGNDLIKTARLIKYLRDHKGVFTMPSFLLTTLIGNHIYDTDKDSNDFKDTPSSLRTIVSRIDSYLNSNYSIPEISNPKNSSESLKHLFGDDIKYNNLKKCWSRYRKWIDDAFNEQNTEESIKKWRNVFGDDFASSYVLSKSNATTTSNIGNTSLASLGAYGANNNNYNSGSKNTTG